MSLRKDDIVELVEKDDNGWWLVKKDGGEGWAPNNYLELVPPAAVHAAPPPPPRKPPPPKAPVSAGASVADVHAKPVSVFPGMGPANGSAAPWKKNVSSAGDDSPGSSRPASALGAGKAAPPPVGTKPKPPVVGAKPGAPPKVGAKPPVPSAARPSAAPAGGAAPGRTTRPAATGQLDLAAAVCVLFFLRGV